VTVQHGSKVCFSWACYSTALHGIVLTLSYKLWQSWKWQPVGMSMWCITAISYISVCSIQPGHWVGRPSRLETCSMLLTVLNWLPVSYNINNHNHSLLWLCQWLVTEGILFSACLCMCDHHKKFVSMISFKPLAGISPNSELRCSWRQKWTL